MELGEKLIKQFLGMEIKPKLLIIGHARHGKDSLAELLNE